METPFATLKNGVSVATSSIPLLEMDTQTWRQTILKHCHKDRARIVACFGVLSPGREGTTRIYSVLGVDHQKILLMGGVELADQKIYTALTPELPEAHLFERELFEDYGIRPEGHPWLKPVRKVAGYPFYQVEGESIHEVAVGPVHAGIIEPGHFRFQCHGEKVLHLEIQLGYQHRGIEKLLVQAGPSRRMLLAESIAGDTVIGHGLTYCQVIEGLSEQAPLSQRAHGLRAIALELERLANHIGDLGALAADIAFLPSAAYFGRMRGEFLNLLMELTGNRYGRSFVRPGGVLLDIPAQMGTDFKKRLAHSLNELKELVDLFFSASSVLSRLESTSVVTPDTARALGLVGPTARACNLSRDVRHDYPTGTYREHPIPVVQLSSGDVYARARIRSLESKRSLEFLQAQIDLLGTGKILGECKTLKPSSTIVSLTEGWRGEIVHVAFTDSQGTLVRYKVVDPSFHNWTALAVAMRDGQISDFPLCNKSFNLSYAGHDL